MKIDPKAYYTATQVSKMGILPWSSVMSFTTALQTKYWQDVFKPVIDKKGKRNRYYINGQAIIDFKKKAASGGLKKG